ncbi:MAG: T9SS type A sorting domain-containing protein, partial [Candidatus Syntrophosphaera sp.]|nr:T9SS type A sorting domain-containing protein [Candidatus Syntrophosphaera sp.]
FAGVVTGAVLSSNPVIDYGRVMVKNASEISTQPDGSGNYMLYLPAGTHNVSATAPGYLTDSLFPVVLSATTPSVEHDFYLGYFAPATGLAHYSVGDTLFMIWIPPSEPLYPVQAYQVYRRVNAGRYEQLGLYVQPEYSEHITLPGTYHYYVVAVYAQGESEGTDPLEFSFPFVPNEDPQNQPLISKLHQNYPNPFNPSTTIRFDLATQSNVKLSVYNVKGQLVRRLLNEARSAGTHNIVWDGRDAQNRPVSSGIYFIRIESRDYTSTRRAILMK